MTTKEARATVRDAHAKLPSAVEAAAALARDSKSTLDDLLSCLDHGGIAAEFAALELYRRTKRPLPTKPGSIVLDRHDWKRFIKKASRETALI